jgi:hypothetical protein
MTGAHMFQAVQHPELDRLGLVAVCNFLKKRARYLRLVAQNNNADGVNVTSIIVVAQIDPELLENCDRIIAPRQPQMAYAIGFRSRELCPKNLVVGTVLRAVLFASAMGFA